MENLECKQIDTVGKEMAALFGISYQGTKRYIRGGLTNAIFII